MSGSIKHVVGLVHEARRRTARERSPSATDWGYTFAIASLCVSALVVALACLAAFVGGSLTLGFGTLVLSAYALARIARRLGGLKRAQDRTLNLVSSAVERSGQLRIERARSESMRRRAWRTRPPVA